ncbi:MAG: phytoene desaturase family protein [Gemmatimonadaceae bacterium]
MTFTSGAAERERFTLPRGGASGLSSGRARDAVIIGSGPNGLSAAITMARAGHRVTVYEAAPSPGGGARSAQLTLPGFTHDICSAVHPLAAGSPYFQQLALERHGLDWIQPAAPVAHPLDGGSAVLLERSIDETASALGADREAYRRLMAPLIADWDSLRIELLGPLRIPRHPLALARFGTMAIRSALGLATGAFRTERAKALFAGIAAHAMLPLERLTTAGFGLVLALAGHAHGWPFPRGGAQRITDALAAVLRSLDGTIEVDRRITALDELAGARTVLCDVTPRGLLALAGDKLPNAYTRALRRYRRGLAAFKVDYALDGPIPWTAPECARAGTVHLGGTLAEIAASERAPWRGEHAERPFVLLSQPTLFDPSRAPAGKHVVWAYCHMPNASTFDMSARIEAQIERFAPGFRDRVLARSVRPPVVMERDNANLVGGDINGGAQDLRQFFARPTWRTYSTPLEGVYICSASTPPGGGVHGMCGYYAACRALRALGEAAPPLVQKTG